MSNPQPARTDGCKPPTLYLTPAHGDVWREGDVLVCTPGANLPPRCIKCNAPADMPSRRYIFHWHHRVIYLALLPYVILAIVLRKRSAHALTLCAQHERRRVRYVAITMTSVLGFLVCGLSLQSEFRWLIGACVVAAMLVIGRFGSRVLSVQSIDHHQARYLGACEDFLRTLPPAP
ncbi:hypothetical protein [Xanthomonas oryzae]|uniref:hypothetical protein n=1 Tax=Xanthomonas oryzae TaxID=347 RepID=UPI0006AC5CC7|nr:hypothetical protein [Xanthomonas oryzae]QBG94188.1 hypothetical protein EYR26_21745 [Xanthomonas oryzae]